MILILALLFFRESKKFGDMHALVMHVFHSQNVDLRIDHLGFHKALCVLMGWNFEKAPETSKAYQSLPSETAVRNREDLILWPPMVIIHKKNGQFEAIGSKEIDGKLKGNLICAFSVSSLSFLDDFWKQRTSFWV